MRKVEGILREDNFFFISNDLTHYVPIVELCNSMIHTNYDERDINIEIDIGFNDGCACQYQHVPAIQRRNISSIRVYFETNHGKSKSDDGLGGVVKGYASREVAATNTVT